MNTQIAIKVTDDWIINKMMAKELPKGISKQNFKRKVMESVNNPGKESVLKTQYNTLKEFVKTNNKAHAQIWKAYFTEKANWRNMIDEAIVNMETPKCVGCEKKYLWKGKDNSYNSKMVQLFYDKYDDSLDGVWSQYFLLNKEKGEEIMRYILSGRAKFPKSDSQFDKLIDDIDKDKQIYREFLSKSFNRNKFGGNMSQLGPDELSVLCEQMDGECFKFIQTNKQHRDSVRSLPDYNQREQNEIQRIFDTTPRYSELIPRLSAEIPNWAAKSNKHKLILAKKAMIVRDTKIIELNQRLITADTLWHQLYDMAHSDVIGQGNTVAAQHQLNIYNTEIRNLRANISKAMDIRPNANRPPNSKDTPESRNSFAGLVV